MQLGDELARGGFKLSQSPLNHSLLPEEAGVVHHRLLVEVDVVVEGAGDAGSLGSPKSTTFELGGLSKSLISFRQPLN